MLQVNKNQEIQENSVLVLQPEAFERFCETMKNPPEPTEKLKKAARAKRTWK